MGYHPFSHTRKLKWISTPSPHVVTSSTQENKQTHIINYGYRNRTSTRRRKMVHRRRRTILQKFLDLDNQHEIRRRKQLHRQPRQIRQTHRPRNLPHPNLLLRLFRHSQQSQRSNNRQLDGVLRRMAQRQTQRLGHREIIPRQRTVNNKIRRHLGQRRTCQ